MLKNYLLVLTVLIMINKNHSQAQSNFYGSFENRHLNALLSNYRVPTYFNGEEMFHLVGVNRRPAYSLNIYGIPSSINRLRLCRTWLHQRPKKM